MLWNKQYFETKSGVTILQSELRKQIASLAMTQIIKFISYTIMYGLALVERKYFVLTTVTLTFLDQTKALASFILLSSHLLHVRYLNLP